MSQAQTWLPVMWVGCQSLGYGPSLITFEQGTAINEKQILNTHSSTEPTGYDAQKVVISGFLKGTTNTVLKNWHWPWTSSGFYKNRPISVGFFTADQADPEMWYCGVGYMAFEDEYPGGHADYLYNYRLNFTEAAPLIRIPTTTAIANGTNSYAFAMTNFTDPVTSVVYASLNNGYIAGLEIISNTSNNVKTTSNQALIWVLENNASTQIGSLPTVLGGGSSTLFDVTTTNFFSAGNGQPASPRLILPVQDTNGNQSVSVSSPTGNYSALLRTTGGGNNSFVTSFLPSAINLIWVPL